MRGHDGAWEAEIHRPGVLEMQKDLIPKDGLRSRPGIAALLACGVLIGGLLAIPGRFVNAANDGAVVCQ